MEERLRHFWDNSMAFKKIRGSQPTPEEDRAKILQTTEELVREIYIGDQINLSTAADNLSAIEEPPSGIARKLFQELKSDVIERASRHSDRLTEMVIDQMFDTAGATEEERRKIRSKALNRAKDYWIDRLAEPNLTQEEITMGQNKITQLTEKLDKLNPPPQKE